MITIKVTIEDTECDGTGDIWGSTHQITEGMRHTSVLLEETVRESMRYTAKKVLDAYCHFLRGGEKR